MVKSEFSSTPPSNQLLAWLPQKEFQRLQPLLTGVELKFKQLLNEARSRIDYVLFPSKGVVSAITLMQDGNSIEVATIGNEGFVGLNAFLGDIESPNRMIVQVPGAALKMDAKVLRTETLGDTPLRQALVRYHAAFQVQVSQAVACNGLHTVQRRCCRWVLMTQDRALADEFPLTHEFLSHMLGVCRVSVTDVLKPLQEAGLICNHRGRIKVLDRRGLEASSCECYRAVKKEFARLFRRKVN
jgi:CRP-like cAMP-binding protein